jgi:phospholipase D1/2
LTNLTLGPGELVYYFSHHEKLCVVDNKLAAMGGLDACYGRWDTRNHPLADVHPTEFFKSLFPGQGESVTEGRRHVLRGC